MRAEGTAWRIDPEHGWTCALCQGFIPAGEPFRASALENHLSAVCLSCIASAVGSVLPGKPARVVVEQAPWNRESPDLLFDLWADGEELGTLTVEAEIDEEQQVPALLTLVCNALEERRARKGLPEAKYPELGKKELVLMNRLLPSSPQDRRKLEKGWTLEPEVEFLQLEDAEPPVEVEP